MLQRKTFILLFIAAILFSACKNKKKSEEESTPEPAPTVPAQPDINNTLGFNLLKKIRGIWNGPVSSTTMLGNYPEWIVDLRPISENQISAKNELDTLNDIFLSFFIAKYNNEFKIAFRNGGSFAGMKRVAYFLVDSVSENGNNSFYRLNNTASQIFLLILDKKNYDSIVNEFSKLNNISKEEAKSDVKEFIKDCKNKGIFL